MSLLVSVGKRIQSLREKRGLTQEQLEEKTGINTKYISAIECGQKNVTIKTLEKIAKSLDIEIFELFLFSEGLESERAAKKAIESLIKEADPKTLNLCLDFLKKSLT
jgi:transcriptional regulator with XRE-family HTH domain